MIGDPILREIVGANLFSASARSDETAAMGGIFLGLFLLFLFQQTGPENRQCFLLVFLLAAAVLTTNDLPCRDMQHLNRSVSRLYALSTRSPRTANFDS